MSWPLATVARKFRWPGGPVLRESELADDQVLSGHRFDAGFTNGDSSYNSCTLGSDRHIYFALSSHHLNEHARVFRLNSFSNDLELMADIGSVVDDAHGSMGHGKIHVDLEEIDGALYASSSQSLKPGVRPYGGGRFLRLDMKDGVLSVVGKAPREQSIISMAADPARDRLYGLTYPNGLLICCDYARGTTRTIGGFFGKGEQGRYRRPGSSPICRSLALDPRRGDLYWSDSLGRIRVYSPESESVQWISECRLSDQNFHGSPIWRQTIWHPQENVFYGVQYRHSVLFRFDPDRRSVENVDHLSAPQYRNKRLRTEPRATLALKLSKNGETLYYVTNGPPLVSRGGRRVRRTLHLITYHLPSRQYRDTGTLRLADGRYPVFCQSLVVDEPLVYAVCWIELPPDYEANGASEIRRARAIARPIESEHFAEEANLVRFVLPGHTG